VKINKAAMEVEVDTEVKDITLEALAADMPETAPRCAEVVVCTYLMGPVLLRTPTSTLTRMIV
jgi:hypothetical protein